MEHDISFWSCFMGEPFLIDNKWVMYSDGKRIQIFSGSIHDNEPISAKTIESTLKYLFDDNKIIEYIEIWGDHKIKYDFHDDTWIRKEYETGEGYVGMQFDIKKFNMSDSKIKKRIKEYQRRNYQSNIYKEPYVARGHIQLIDKFLKSHKIDTFDLSYNITYPYFIISQYATVIEVKKNNKLIGIASMSTYLKKANVLTHIFINKDYPNVTDFIYHFYLQETLSQNKAILDVGYSMHPSLKKYKLNWGVNLIRQSVKGIQLFKNQSMLKSKYFHWMPNLLFENYGTK
ncbi:MAG: hypothetical protein U5L09_10465 [Bacteroidales bacterium]|nr:hypothetical protein [Bacteroidales bacterium]